MFGGDQCHQQGGATGAVCPGPPGPQPVPDLFKISSSVTFQSSFFKGLVLLYFRVKSACSFPLCFMLLKQIILVATAQSATQGPIRCTFQSETANRRRQLAGIYVLCACTKKELQEPPEHTSEHVKFPGGMSPDPLTKSILWGPTFCICPGPPQSSRRPCW